MCALETTSPRMPYEHQELQFQDPPSPLASHTHSSQHAVPWETAKAMAPLLGAHFWQHRSDSTTPGVGRLRVTTVWLSSVLEDELIFD